VVALSMSETEFVNNFGNLLSFVNLEVSKWLFVAAKTTIIKFFSTILKIKKYI
jgi:hypothetical protein